MKAVQSIRSSSYRQTRHQSTSVGSMYENMKKSVINYAMGGKRPTIASAKLLLYNCKDQTNRPIWYKDGLVSTEFRPKHTLLMTHAWMVHKRLIKEGSEGRLIQECMFDELWEDTCNRLRAIGINELSVNKYLSEVQSYSFQFCVELDQALTKPTEEEVVQDIGGALWRHAYVGNDDIEEEHVLKFARYLRAEQLSVMTLPFEAMTDGRIKWGPIPKFDPNAVDVVERKKTKEELAVGEWKETMDVTGKMYYWNTATRKTSWEKPASFLPAE